MPTLTKNKKQIDLKQARSTKEASKDKDDKVDEEDIKETTKSKSNSVSSTRSLMDLAMQDDDYDDSDDDDEDGEEDDVIRESIESKENGVDKKYLYGFAAIGVVVIVVILFLIFGRGRTSTESDEPVDENLQALTSDTVETNEPPEVPDDTNLGTQDFTKDTTMLSDSEMSDPDNYTKDLYGLTLRVDYNVAKIQEASDFVSYTKCRGTWGGGLELYYLDTEYKGNKYVIQVPFKYYKELDDSGIVPVKMEVLRVQSETDGEYLTIISYMSLDEKTLQSVLKSQKK